MRRDWDVIRIILLKVEALPDKYSHVIASEIDEIDEDVANYHMRLLGQAGLIVGANLDRESGTCTARMLTWEGHEFLDGIKQDTVWNKVKNMIREKGVDVSFHAIKTVTAILVSTGLR